MPQEQKRLFDAARLSASELFVARAERPFEGAAAVAEADKVVLRFSVEKQAGHCDASPPATRRRSEES
jgi:hypothetical protein